MAPVLAAGQPATARDAAVPYRWYVVAVLACGHLLSFVDRYVMSLLMEPLKADLRLSDAQLGLLQGTGFVILYTVVTLPLGRMADRVHRRNLIVAGMLVWSVATAMCGFAGSFPTLFAARVAVGFGEAALVPAAMSLIAAYVPRAQLGRAVSLFTSGSSLGKSAAFIGGGAVLAALVASGGVTLPGLGRFAPWQGTFLAAALPGLGLAAILLTIREPARPVDTGARATVADAIAYLGEHRRAYLLHAIGATAVVLLIQSFSAWEVAYFGRVFHLTPAEAGLNIGAIILVAAPLGHLSGGMLTDLAAARGRGAAPAPVMAISLIASVVLLMLFLSCRSLGGSFVLLALLTFTMSLGAAPGLYGVQMLTPDRLRGVVTALFMAFVTFVGIGFGPAVVGLAADGLGGPARLGTALALVLGIVAAVGVVAIIAGRTAFARTANRLS